MSQAALWEPLFEQPQHQLGYPSEHVVRFLASAGPGKGRWAVDIGCGAGRHSKLLRDYGWDVSALDASQGAVDYVRAQFGEEIGVTHGKMTNLPWADSMFDLAVAYGVFYYGTNQEHEAAVAELHRVLKPGGQGFVVTRTWRDSRAKTGEWVDVFTRRMTSGDEQGMLINFLELPDVLACYGEFSEVGVEMSETTRDSRKWRDSDWLIRVTK